jgi:alpha-galactosidase
MTITFIDAGSPGDAYPLIDVAMERPEVLAAEPVRNEPFLTFGRRVTESSGHNSEYNPCSRKRKDLVERCCTHGINWNPGEHAYTLKEHRRSETTWRDEARSWFSKDRPIDLARGGECAAWIIVALAGGPAFRFNGNAQDRGCIGDLPPQCALSTSCCSSTVEAAARARIEGNPELVFQAIAHDPLKSAELPLAEIRNLVGEMLEVDRDFLPQFGTLEL